MFESGFESLAERRNRKIINTVIHVAENISHPVYRWFKETEAYMENVNTLITAIPKGTATARIKAEIGQTIKGEGLEEYVRFYTGESLMEVRVGCAIICEAREIKIRLPKQMSIFNAEAVAILKAIKTTRRWKTAKKIILTDSLRWLKKNIH
jgi:hypothetical protein